MGLRLCLRGGDDAVEAGLRTTLTPEAADAPALVLILLLWVPAATEALAAGLRTSQDQIQYVVSCLNCLYIR